MELDGGGSTVGLQSFIESTLFTVGAKVSRSGNKVRRSWRGNSVVQGGNSSRTRPNTRSNQFASPETMSSPLLSEPIELTAPGLISGIDAVQSSSSCSPVVPGSFILSPLSLSLSLFFLLRDFYSKFNWIEIFYEERGRKKVSKNKKVFFKQDFKEWMSILQKRKKEKDKKAKMEFVRLVSGRKHFVEDERREESGRRVVEKKGWRKSSGSEPGRETS